MDKLLTYEELHYYIEKRFLNSTYNDPEVAEWFDTYYKIQKLKDKITYRNMGSVVLSTAIIPVVLCVYRFTQTSLVVDSRWLTIFILMFLLVCYSVTNILLNIIKNREVKKEHDTLYSDLSNRVEHWELSRFEKLGKE